MKAPFAILLVILALCAVLYFGWDDEDAEPLGLVGSVVGKLGSVVQAAANEVRKLSAAREQSKREIAAAVERYRGAIPFGTLMAICEHESGFNPDAYNSKEIIRNGVSYGHARGPWQILDGLQGDYGVDSQSVTDIDASTRGACNARQKSHQIIAEMAPDALGNFRDYTYLLYLGHFAGNGSVSQRKGLRWKIQQAIDRGQPVTADTVGGYGHEAGLKAVADRASYWEDQRAALLAEAGA